MDVSKTCLPGSLASKILPNENPNLQSGKALDFNEYKVRLPRMVSKSYNIMRFNVPVDISSIEEATMERQIPIGEEKGAKTSTSHGAGSEYGAERREEARRRRRGVVDKKVKNEDLPWNLVVGRKKKAKRYTGNKEKEITANACYYVFTQCPDGAFEAFPVDSFYRFSTAINYQTLSSEEAEEQFAQRHKILNYHSLMIKKKLEKVKDESEKDAESEEKPEKNKQNSLDEENWMSDSSNEDDEEEQSKDEDSKNQGKKKTKSQKGKGKKKASGSDSDQESEEDGFIDSKEVDYMSTDTSDEEEKEEKEEETGNTKESTKDDLNAYLGTESEEEEEDEDLTNSGKELKAILKREEGGETSDDESYFDDDDDSYSKSAVLQGKKKKSKSGSPSSTSSSSRSSTPTLDTTKSTITAAANKLSEHHQKAKGKKRPNPKAAGTDSGGPPQKKSKSSNPGPTATPPLTASGTSSPAPSDGPSHGITEDAIRRYLSRKPMTTKDLLQKFKTKRTGLTNAQTVQQIGTILRKIAPEQKRIDGKLYLTLKST